MNSTKYVNLATIYSERARSAMSLGISAEPEAQLTIPLANFLTDFSQTAGLGELGLIREAQLDGVRPDFAATINNRQCGWVELKAPGHSLAGDKWRGREKEQWILLSELDALLVTNGEAIALYNEGKCVDQCDLPLENINMWSAEALKDLLQKFIFSKPATIKRVNQLSSRLAPLARFLRLRLEEGLENNLSGVKQAKEAWDTTVLKTNSNDQFASDVAQVIAYSMAIAGLSGQADLNKDGKITLQEAKEALSVAHRNVLAAALGPIIGIPDLMEFIAPEIGAISRLVSSLDISAIQSSLDARGEPWLWFYEDFLAKYDPAAREQAGVYYTPTSIVECQVRIVNNILTQRFKQSLGFGSKSVVTLDPATGSGTYPLAVIDQAVETAYIERGPAGAQQVANNLTKNILAFEILPGPYSVAHLRIGQRLAQAKEHLVNTEELGVYLTDTLADPTSEERIGLFGDAKVLAEATEKARQIKADKKITVAIGNPPYDRVSSENGGWILSGDNNQDPLFNDIINPAKETGVIFSAQASLYNLYVYFWRWAIWKAFQQAPEEQAVISFITASSWLSGPAFVGLRKLAVETANDIWVIDLGGEGRGARKEENVFDIQSPVAIVTLVKSGKATKKAKVYYKRIRGDRAEKLASLDKIEKLQTSEDWVTVYAPNGEPFIPQTNNALWDSFALLADIFPWQQPGIKYNRLWPVAPSTEVLRLRWQELLASESDEERAQKFVTSTTGRNIHTKVSGLNKIAELPVGAAPQPLVRMGWRSFDQQWTFDDPRLAKTESPALWQSLSKNQIFLVSPWSARIANGPAATVSVGVPDLHYFCNRGGKDVIPLYRDQECTQPNITATLMQKLQDIYGFEITPEVLMAYCYALIAHDGYSGAFKEPLENSPVRIPVTADAELFKEAAAIGEELLWLQTFGERFVAENRPYASVPKIDGLHWLRPVTTIPFSSKDIYYDEVSSELHIGDGVISNVSPAVWNFEISGLRVLDKWLGARTQKGIGRASGKTATPLDLIRPTEWEDEWNDELLNLLRMLTRTLELAPRQASLLQTIVEGDIIKSDSLPKPSDTERKVPKTVKRNFGQTAMSF